MQFGSVFELRRFVPVAVAAAILSMTVAIPSAAQQTPPPLPATQGSFYVGGQYITVPNVGTVMDGAMYVQSFIPNNVTHPFPIVLIHGGVGAGGTWTGTPDGREGWAQFFVRRGYVVYAVDQPARGRSVYNPATDGAIGQGTVLSNEQMFTAPEAFNLWPQAHLHTQWPSNAPNCTTVALGCKGQQGDPIFDNFMRGALNSISDGALNERLNRAAGAALLDRIGPAIVLGRSQSGPFPWIYADARPNLVKAMISLEPSGPPFFNVTFLGPPTFFADGTLGRPFGITATPITYSPAVTEPSQLVRVQQTAPDQPNLVKCWMQGAPVHTLPTLQGRPTIIITTQASYHAPYDHCTAKYLMQAGVSLDHVRLENVGIFGNGHLMNSERNSEQIAAFLLGWLQRKGL